MTSGRENNTSRVDYRLVHATVHHHLSSATVMQSNQHLTPGKFELELVDKLKGRFQDLCLDKWHLETGNLLRFLRARNHSVENAEIMFRKVIEWRAKHDIDHILDWRLPPHYKKYWPWYVCGVDKMGNPVLIMPMGLWDPSKVGIEGYNTFVRYCYRSTECFFHLIQQRSVGLTAMKQVIMIIDCKDLSWKTVTTIDAMQGVVDLFKCADAYYPEILRLAYIINAPYAFSLAWRLVKPFLSEHTQTKVHFLHGTDPACWRQELATIMEANQLPQQYGGDQPDGTEIDIEKE